MGFQTGVFNKGPVDKMLLILDYILRTTVLNHAKAQGT